MDLFSEVVRSPDVLKLAVRMCNTGCNLNILTLSAQVLCWISILIVFHWGVSVENQMDLICGF